VAVIEDVPSGIGTITAAELDQEMLQLASFEGKEDRPHRGDEEYDQVAEQALASLIVAVWLRGQAEELGVSINPRQVARELRGDEARGLREANYTRKTIEERMELNLATEGIRTRLGERAADPTEEEARLFYAEEGLDEQGSFAEMRSDIETQLKEQKQQEVYSAVDVSFPLEWQLRTQCAKAFNLEQCAGFPSFARLSSMPRAGYEEEREESVESCPAPVVGRSVVLPGTTRPWRPEGDRRVQSPVPPGGGEAEAVE